MTTTQTITIELPQRLYDQLQRTAELSHQPVTAVVQQTLSHSLPPLLEDIPADYQADVYPLLQMDLAQLQHETQRTFPQSRWQRYEQLLDKKKRVSLTDQERRELAELRYEADVLTFRKGYAAVLLKRRGYAVPSPGELPTVQ